MPRLSRLAGTTALALVLGTGLARADVTPAQVWDDMQQYLEGFGYQVTATESTAGNTLRLDGLTITMPIPDPKGTVTVNVDGMALTDLGDGTVSIDLPASLPMHFSVEAEGLKPVSGMVTYSLQNMRAILSGDPDHLVTTMSADSIGLSLDEITASAQTLGPDNFKVNLTFSGLDGTSTMVKGDTGRDFDQSGKIATFAYDLDIQPPEETGRLKVNGQLADMAYAFTGMVPAQVDLADMAAALAAGFAIDGHYTYGASAAQFSFEDGRDQMEGSGSATNGRFGVTMNKDRLAYSAGASDARFDAVGSSLPLPVMAKMAEALFDLSIPLQPGDDPQDFSLAIKLGGFETSDLLWSMFDVGGVLPRDPATIDLAVSGKAKVLINVMGPQMGMRPGPPAELEQLTVDRLHVEAAGAKVTGTGAFTFDNSDMQSFDGFPRPEGMVDLAVAGANGLMDKLVQMGLLPEQQAMGARMMLGMFTVPGDGPDNLTSHIEINDQGQVLANGQRLK